MRVLHGRMQANCNRVPHVLHSYFNSLAVTYMCLIGHSNRAFDATGKRLFWL